MIRIKIIAFCLLIGICYQPQTERTSSTPKPLAFQKFNELKLEVGPLQMPEDSPKKEVAIYRYERPQNRQIDEIF